MVRSSGDNGSDEERSDGKKLIKLRFEPKGRPSDEMDFYRCRKRICVVCGGDKTSLMHKNIVPKEYRKNFPETLKSHSSHDVVLLCSSCHRRASVYEQQFKQHLSELCDAPLTASRAATDEDLKRVRSAARALNGCRDKLPAEKAEEFYSCLAQHYAVEEVTDELIQGACDIEHRGESAPLDHGQAVVKYYVRTSSLQKFQKAWRLKFLEAMEPQHMGEHWRVDYNHLEYIPSVTVQ